MEDCSKSGYNFRSLKVWINPYSNLKKNAITFEADSSKATYSSNVTLIINDSIGDFPFKVQKMGMGRVIVFTDNTNFRAFWYGTNKLLMNAIFFGDKM